MTFISSSEQAQRGVTLLEMMIAMALGLMVLSAVIVLYTQTARTFHQQHAMADLQVRGRMATQLLGEELRRTGFWGEIMPPARSDSCSDMSKAIRIECALPVWGGTAEHAKTLGLVPKSALKSDAPASRPAAVVAVRYVDHGNGTCLTLDQDRALTLGESCQGNWRYRDGIYYLRMVDDEYSGESVPALYVNQRSASGSYSSSEIVRHVEAFEVEWGRDETGDGSINRFYNSEAVAHWQIADWDRVMAARLYIVMRSEKMALPMPAREFLVAGRTLAFEADHYQRRLFVTTATLRNSRLGGAYGL
ncbi:PilW family protein [Kushneria indalinina]|uniref:Prepilin-type N-terminal cleavage/methylation domain-containing protein n=1 Tax=Kushneria indalinina DSM 14324 TaxID=1122140 RepID=A0A3D9DUX0_9GAMM|nr:PilW family protein [Kushneria indalinina]REC94546.1 prepilin-type N-terminal cleavage/methylation domain-containing protein [Kushneria indalinina DSM 14324]